MSEGKEVLVALMINAKEISSAQMMFAQCQETMATNVIEMTNACKASHVKIVLSQEK